MQFSVDFLYAAITVVVGTKSMFLKGFCLKNNVSAVYVASVSRVSFGPSGMNELHVFSNLSGEKIYSSV